MQIMIIKQNKKYRNSFRHKGLIGGRYTYKIKMLKNKDYINYPQKTEEKKF
jgi:hypothetical protein